MGLDQYLYASKYVSGVRGAQDLFNDLVQTVNAENFVHSDYPSVELKVKVGYWRKANQIHQWFVDNVQDGEDNCAQYYVSRERLEDLVKICKEALETKDPDTAQDLLPPQEGFFFGSYEIDEGYWYDLENTVEQIERLLATVPNDWDFYYRSSW